MMASILSSYPTLFWSLQPFYALVVWFQLTVESSSLFRWSPREKATQQTSIPDPSIESVGPLVPFFAWIGPLIIIYHYTVLMFHVIPLSFQYHSIIFGSRYLWSESGQGTALISVDSRDQLNAVQEIRQMWSGESGDSSVPIRISVKGCRMPGIDMQPSRNHRTQS